MPHFHAYYQDHVGIYDIDRVERLAGSLPRRQERLVLAELHQEELLSNGRRCTRAVRPLRLNR